MATPGIRSLPLCSLLASSTWVKNSAAILPYLVTGNTESLEKNHFDDVICNQRFWLARSTFRLGDNSNVGECPDPSSSCEGSGSKTSLCACHALLAVLLYREACMWTECNYRSSLWEDIYPYILCFTCSLKPAKCPMQTSMWLLIQLVISKSALAVFHMVATLDLRIIICNHSGSS